MSYATEHKRKFDELLNQIKNYDQLSRNANGGNSILFTYPPEEEELYIKTAKEIFNDKGVLIDIASLYVRFIDTIGLEVFEEQIKGHALSLHKIFGDASSSDYDLFDMVIDEILKVSNLCKIPILVRTGAFYGTGIENIHVMEHKKIMSLKNPLILFYPSIYHDGSIYFLNEKIASHYRCVVVK